MSLSSLRSKLDDSNEIFSILLLGPHGAGKSTSGNALCKTVRHDRTCEPYEVGATIKRCTYHLRAFKASSKILVVDMPGYNWEFGKLHDALPKIIAGIKSNEKFDMKEAQSSSDLVNNINAMPADISNRASFLVICVDCSLPQWWSGNWFTGYKVTVPAAYHTYKDLVDRCQEENSKSTTVFLPSNSFFFLFIFLPSPHHPSIFLSLFSNSCSFFFPINRVEAFCAFNQNW